MGYFQCFIVVDEAEWGWVLRDGILKTKYQSNELGIFPVYSVASYYSVYGK